MTAANDKAERISAAIKAWDKEDINVLKSLLEKLQGICDENDLDMQAYVDMTSLPSADIPDDIDTGFPVWAMDAHRDMLVGDNQIMSVTEYRDQLDDDND